MSFQGNLVQLQHVEKEPGQVPDDKGSPFVKMHWALFPHTPWTVVPSFKFVVQVTILSCKRESGIMESFGSFHTNWEDIYVTLVTPKYGERVFNVGKVEEGEHSTLH